MDYKIVRGSSGSVKPITSTPVNPGGVVEVLNGTRDERRMLVHLSDKIKFGLHNLSEPETWVTLEALAD